MMIAFLAAASLQPVPLSLHEAQTLGAQDLAARLLDGVEHREITGKSVDTDANGSLAHIVLAEVGRASGPSQCARTTHRLTFERGQLSARTVDHALALGTDCEKPPRWIRLQSGATPEIGAKLLKELTAAQARLRKGEPSGLDIDCVDETRRGLCAPDLDWQFGTMDIAMLGAIGFTLNTATAFQDVAVDGLAVDIMTEEERARGSGMMFGGQSIGVAAATAICGYVIDDLGAPAAFLTVAALLVALCLYTLAIRERHGEKIAPWSEGAAHQRNVAIQLGAWWPLLRSTFTSLFARASIFWMIAAFGSGILYGGMTGTVPLIGANYLGWDVSTISSHNAVAGLVGGVLCMTLGGWLGDRFGAKRIGIFWILVTLGLLAVMYFSESSWSNPVLFLGFAYGWLALNVLRTVALLPIPMRLCDATVAATQFTIYMAVANFGISFGAFMLGMSDRLGGLTSIFLVSGAGLCVTLVLLLTIRFPRRPEYYEIQKRREIMAAQKPA